MDSGLTASDVLAMTKNNDGFLGGCDSGGWFLIIILLFLLGGGNFGFGNRAEGTPLATAQQSFDIDKDVLTSGCSTQKEILQSRYDSALAMNNLQAQMAQCCCSIKEAISADGQATRQLITDNTINDLREKLNSANTAIVNAQQTEAILNQLGRFMPYTSMYGYGASYSNFPYGLGTGTVI